MINYDFTLTLPLLLSAVTLAYTWWATRDRNTEARFKAAAERSDRQEARINSLEQTLRAQPSKDDVHELHLSMREMQGELKTMTAIMDGNKQIMARLEAIVARHEEHLLDGTKR